MDLYNVRRQAKIFVQAACGFLLLNVLVFCTVFRRPDKRWKKETYDCAIVCGYYAEEDGSPSPVMKSRVEKGVSLLREGKAACLLLSGGAVANPHVEAEVMEAYALELGAAQDVLYTEAQAVSTYHNMMYSKAVMEKHGLKDCIIVTNGWHLRKADHYARKFHLDHVMCKADDPAEQTWLCGALYYMKTWWNMYSNLFRGYW